jgi:hypothetical protein
MRLVEAPAAHHSDHRETTREPIPDSADQLQDGHPHKWLKLASVSTGLVLGVLDASVVNLASLPLSFLLGRRLGDELPER